MTKEEKRHKDKLAQIGCMACRRLFGITDSPVELCFYLGKTAVFIGEMVKLASPQRWSKTDAGSKQSTSLKGHHA